MWQREKIICSVMFEIEGLKEQEIVYQVAIILFKPMSRVSGSVIYYSCFNPLRPNSDLSQTSHCNIKDLSVCEVMRIENMVPQVQFS